MSSAWTGRRSWTVHPHACGDDVVFGLIVLAVGGSPPRLWGRCRSPWQRTAACSVHPHACGDDAAGQRPLCRYRGSPPRLWGRCIQPQPAGTDGRFTPTPVGTMRPAARRTRAAPVHPHACGDDANSPAAASALVGSPPRLWGRLRLRLTGGRYCPVHPHACGDDDRASIIVPSTRGSPPRLWGRCVLEAILFRFNRFTPTPVGTMRTGSDFVSFQSVHPHACGDDSTVVIRFALTCGSPPRLWGR